MPTLARPVISICIVAMTVFSLNPSAWCSERPPGLNLLGAVHGSGDLGAARSGRSSDAFAAKFGPRGGSGAGGYGEAPTGSVRGDASRGDRRTAVGAGGGRHASVGPGRPGSGGATPATPPPIEEPGNGYGVDPILSDAEVVEIVKEEIAKAQAAYKGEPGTTLNEWGLVVGTTKQGTIAHHGGIDGYPSNIHCWIATSSAVQSRLKSEASEKRKRLEAERAAQESSGASEAGSGPGHVAATRGQRPSSSGERPTRRAAAGERRRSHPAADSGGGAASSASPRPEITDRMLETEDF